MSTTPKVENGTRGETSAPTMSMSQPASPARWDLEALKHVPKTFAAPGFSSEGLRPLFFEGLPFRGRPTRHFCWIGVPEAARSRRVPGVVLAHGGCGTAFAAWARVWLQRGYAVIAPDICGQTPRQGVEDNFCDRWPRHEWGGPPPWGGSFDTLDLPLEEQWPFHAIAGLCLAHSLLASQPEVDENKVVLTGVSWGGTLACIMAGVDSRLRAVAPVYGSGYLQDRFTYFASDVAKEKRDRWLDLYNPLHFLPNAEMPLLFTTGTNDRGCPLDHQLYSANLARGKSTLCVKLRMVHGHGGVSETPQEIWRFFDSVLLGGKPLLELTGQELKGQTARATYRAVTDVARAELLYTLEDGPMSERLWHQVPAKLDAKASTAEASLPPGTRAFFLNIEDYRGLTVSTPHQELG